MRSTSIPQPIIETAATPVKMLATVTASPCEMPLSSKFATACTLMAICAESPAAIPKVSSQSVRVARTCRSVQEYSADGTAGLAPSPGGLAPSPEGEGWGEGPAVVG